MKNSRWINFVCLLFCFGAAARIGAGQDGRWAILISGASGDPGLQKLYLKEISDLYRVLEGTFEIPRDRIFVLFDNPAMNPELIQYKSTRENLQQVCHNLAGRVTKEDTVFVFIEGHGNYDRDVYKLNLVGRYDPTAEDVASMLYSIPAKRFIVANMTNCSGGSIPALSRKGTILITATKSGMEKNQTRIGRYFVEAFVANAADSDKNDRVSLLEAFAFASHRVDEYYQSEGYLKTEHAVLEDNGDAQAQSDPTPENGEGILASTTFLDTGVPDLRLKGLTPEQQKLALEAQELMKQIESLKYEKSEIPEAEYEKRLEDLLLRLARINEKLPH